MGLWLALLGTAAPCAAVPASETSHDDGPARSPAPTAPAPTAPAPIPAPAPATAGAPMPRPLVIPAPLRQHVPQIETSALVWAPTLRRYLVVIDDTIDTDEGTRRAPFVLGLDAAGRLDAEPIAIAGIDEIDDAEALTSDGAGSFYLMTSHSPNKSGKVKRARRQLLRLRLEGRQLRVTGALDLLHERHGVSRVLELLGLPAAVSVDMEGLTFHHGALYIGMKAPLLNQESALILRFDHADAAFARGHLAKGDLAAWSKVKLGVPAAAGRTVPQGIADLLFGPDGALYLCANSPKGHEKDGGGALWRVAEPRAGVVQATMLRRFPGLKPEGLALAPDGRSLAIVFDRDRLDPVWTEWRL